MYPCNFLHLCNFFLWKNFNLYLCFFVMVFVNIKKILSLTLYVTFLGRIDHCSLKVKKLCTFVIFRTNFFAENKPGKKLQRNEKTKIQRHGHNISCKNFLGGEQKLQRNKEETKIQSYKATKLQFHPYNLTYLW